MRYLFSLAIMALGLSVVSAQAASPYGNLYGSVYLGATVLSPDDRWSDGLGFVPYQLHPDPAPAAGMEDTRSGRRTDTRNVEFAYDPGFDIGGAVGGWFGNYLRADVSIGYRVQDADVKTRIVAKDIHGALYTRLVERTVNGQRVAVLPRNAEGELAGVRLVRARATQTPS